MTERNELCPCGSGLKYKKCHGINATKGGSPTVKKLPKEWDEERNGDSSDVRCGAFKRNVLPFLAFSNDFFLNSDEITRRRADRLLSLKKK